MQLFCFPYGGSGPSMFRHWGPGLPPWVEVHALALPGREARLREKPYARIAPLVDAIADGIDDALHGSFAFFGHSMGALLCFELAHRLVERRRPLPALIFVSGSDAPHLKRPPRTTCDLEDDELIEELRKYKGTPSEVLSNRNFMNIVLPSIRADFELIRNYQYEQRLPLPIDIIALGGRNDPSVSLDKVRGWCEHTIRAFEFHSFPGDHFFINSHGDEVLAFIRETLEARNDPAQRRARGENDDARSR